MFDNLPEKFELKVPDSVNEAVENLTSPVTKQLGVALGNIFYIVFSPLNLFTDKMRIKRAAALEKFRLEVEENVNKIPNDNLCDPDMQVLIGSLKDSEQCIEKDELRAMFSKLIASSMDASKCNFIHPSFSSIIKNMSPIDAKILKGFGDSANHPIARLRTTLNDAKISHTLIRYISTLGADEISPYDEAISIDNLIRSRIVDVSFDTHFADEAYDDIYNSQLYQQHASIHQGLSVMDFPTEFPEELRASFKTMQNRELLVDKGIITLTDYGLQFKIICLD